MKKSAHRGVSPSICLETFWEQSRGETKRSLPLVGRGEREGVAIGLISLRTTMDVEKATPKRPRGKEKYLRAGGVVSLTQGCSIRKPHVEPELCQLAWEGTRRGSLSTGKYGERSWQRITSPVAYNRGGKVGLPFIS